MAVEFTLAQALDEAHALGLDALDAQRLLLHVLGHPDAGRAWLIAHDGDAMPSAAQNIYLDLCRQRARKVPLAYLTGERGFYGLTLHVDGRVLDPRPDTETLVDWALAVLRDSHWRAPEVLDLGTGSGAIALAIRYQHPAAEVSALDASEPALDVARANGERLGLPVRWRHGHWLNEALPHERWHLVVSNPPYIAEQDPHLAALHAEPRSALVAGPQGLDDLRCIVAQSGQHLIAGGWLLLEHGHDQSEAVQALLHDAGFTQVQGRPDLTGIVRCSGGQWPTQ